MGINLTEVLCFQYTKIYKTLMKEIEEDTNARKDTQYSRFGRSNIVKIFMLPKVIYWFNETTIKIPTSFFTEIEKNCKIHIKQTKNGIKVIMREKNKARDITLVDFKVH